MEQIKNRLENPPSREDLRGLTTVAATIDDSDFVYQLKKIVLQQYVEQTWQRWDEDFQRRFHKEHFNIEQTRIIKMAGQPAGTVDIAEGKANIFISGLYILPQYQSQGIGSKVLAELEQEASSKSKRLDLEVLRVNTRAQALYKRLGFTIEEGDEHKLYLYKDF